MKPLPVPEGKAALAFADTFPLPEIVILASDNLAAAVNSLSPLAVLIVALNVLTVIPDRSAL